MKKSRPFSVAPAWLAATVISLLAPQWVVAQTVQLPTFTNFVYRGSVKVPDGGTLRVGGVGSYAEGSSWRGVPGVSGIPGLNRAVTNRGIGRETASGDLTIRPKILIMSELEEDHLAAAGYDPEGRPRVETNEAAILAKAAFLSKHVGRNQPVEAAADRR